MRGLLPLGLAVLAAGLDPFSPAAADPGLPSAAAVEEAVGGQATEPVAVGDRDAGRNRIQSLGCGACHRIPGIPGAIGIVGPPLEGFGRRPFIAGSLPNRPEVLVRFIFDPPALIPDTAMPRMPLNAQDARDIAAYLATLR